MEDMTNLFETHVGAKDSTIKMWNPNIHYSKGEIVVYFKEEPKQKSEEFGQREFVFVLVSTKDENDSVPNYNLVNGLPDFSPTNWNLINPTSYLLQDLIEMKKVVKEVFSNILEKHVGEEHGLIGAANIERNLVKNDYSNIISPWEVGKYAFVSSFSRTTNENGTMRLGTDGVMEYQIRYSFDSKANQYLYINDSRYYYEKSPIFDESDNTIFSQKYTEDNLFSVNVMPVEKTKDDGTVVVEYLRNYSNLRYGTNVFHKRISFDRPFVNDQYLVFFDTYGNGEFVFGYDKNDLQVQTEPTWDAVVSMPMLMNKTKDGFDIVLPVHCHFNSLRKYNVGVPWNNSFTLQAIGRYR